MKIIEGHLSKAEAAMGKCDAEDHRRLFNVIVTVGSTRDPMRLSKSYSTGLPRGTHPRTQPTATCSKG